MLIDVGKTVKKHMKSQLTMFLLPMRQEWVSIIRFIDLVIWSYVQERSESAEQCQVKSLYLRSENIVGWGWVGFFFSSPSLYLSYIAKTCNAPGTDLCEWVEASILFVCLLVSCLQSGTCCGCCDCVCILNL